MKISMNLIITHATLLIKYILLFGYFYFSGRSFIEFVRRYFLNNKKILQIQHDKKTIIYPLVGIVFIRNLLIIVHFIFVELVEFSLIRRGFGSIFIDLVFISAPSGLQDASQALARRCQNRSDVNLFRFGLRYEVHFPRFLEPIYE